ncbi:hypothetical protein JAO29_04310 [Edaphobacter sp. HDX4]|uniref:hypothetical protein n=1 Tax=Edaphobacter sp. HDX4 TaxID=2794064 RepID=UPI002FE6674A
MTTQIKSFFQALLSTFDQSSELTWSTINDTITVAVFSTSGMNVMVRFSPLDVSCLVDYQITGRRTSTTECVRSSLSVYSGVLHALRIFHRVHGPVAYRFAEDDQALAELWDAYRQCPRPSGYETQHAFAH